MRWTFLLTLAAFGLALLALALVPHVGRTVVAQPALPPPMPGQSPPPSPRPTPQTIAIPGEATIAPGEVVAFRRPSDGAMLAVSYHSGNVQATATYDGAVLTFAVPPLGPGDVLSGGATGTVEGESPTCTRVNNQRNVLRCDVQPTVEGRTVEFRLELGIPPGWRVARTSRAR